MTSRPAPIFRGFAGSILTAATGAALGLGVVALESRGVGTIPAVALATAVLATGSVFLPFRYVAFGTTILACHQGFLSSFGGSPGTYWKEVVVLVLVMRALRRRLPSQVELIASCAAAAIFLLYALSGADDSSVAWGIKLLALFAVAGWAVMVLADGGEWDWVFSGLALSAASSCVIAFWQVNTGADGLLALGFEYGKSVRHASGQLRAFAAFNYAAPFAYAMAIATLGWLSLVFVRRYRLALQTSWVALLGLVGIVLSLNRIALVGIVVAVLLGLVRHHASPSVITSAAFGAIALAVVTGPSVRDFLVEGFTLRADSLAARFEIWQKRVEDLTLFGHGPATAGAAYDRVASLSDQMAVSAVVDNLYLAWAYQYGLLLGFMLTLIWVGVLLKLYLGPVDGHPLAAHAGLVAVFAIVAAAGVNFWEEFPPNLLLALIGGLAFARTRRVAVADPAGLERVSFARPIAEPSVRGSQV